MSYINTRKCINCQIYFNPDPRSKGCQKYCSHASCQKASIRASQKKWLQKPENQNHFKGRSNVQRVQAWRSKNPGYLKKSRQSQSNGKALQDIIITQPIEEQEKKGGYNRDALQDIIISQPAVLIGLIANLAGSALQDDIVKTGQKLRELGEDFLNHPDLIKGAYSDDTLPLTQSKTTT